MQITIDELLKKENPSKREQALLITLLDAPLKQELKKEPITRYEQAGEFVANDVAF